jgi:hypothetical protein
MRLHCVLTPVITVGLALGSAQIVRAAPIFFKAALDGPSEAQPNNSPGAGSATFFIDPILHQLGLSVTFSGLTGTTTAAHIHCCTANAGQGAIGVATETPTFGSFPLGVTSGSYNNTYDTTLAASFNAPFITNNGGTVAGAEAALFQGIIDGKAYLNIHSTVFGSGEIRGFLVPAAAASEPANLALLGLGLGALCGVRRRVK